MVSRGDRAVGRDGGGEGDAAGSGSLVGVLVVVEEMEKRMEAGKRERDGVACVGFRGSWMINRFGDAGWCAC